MSSQDDIWQKVFRRREEIVTRKIAGETILVPIRGKLADMQRLFVLNSVAEYVWDHIDGKTSVDEIRQGVLAEFDTDQDEVDKDTREFVGELIEADLIEETA
ncbi:MAG: PqqD family protein [Planctomycetes bacterium]|nr:PqqD family protein [Planctomycetota bacterium]